MDSPAGRPQQSPSVQDVPKSRGAFPGGKSLAMLAGAVFTLIAGIVGAVLAVALAASVVVIALMGGVLLFLAGLAYRMRGGARAKGGAGGPQILEARHVGGHSWVAYGWERRQ